MGCWESNRSQRVVRLYVGSFSDAATRKRSSRHNWRRNCSIQSRASAQRIDSGVARRGKGQARRLAPLFYWIGMTVELEKYLFPEESTKIRPTGCAGPVGVVAGTS